MTQKDLTKCDTGCRLLTIPLHEYITEWLKRPNMVKLYKNKKELFSGKVKFEVINNEDINAIIDIKMSTLSTEQQRSLFDALALKSVPFNIHLYHNNWNGIVIDGANVEAQQMLASFTRL